ncbi:MAG TPA: PAS domain S-box protein [Verrucomicrobiae bacterium]|nr:PAS domain S-box protein [Verrucomicrobiae bacterium]
MKKTSKKKAESLRQNAGLRARLKKAQKIPRAVRTGKTDAPVRGGQARRAEAPYRALIESSNEGVGMLAKDGTILYANPRLAQLLRTPLPNLIGSQLRGLVASACWPTFDSLLARGKRGPVTGELLLQPKDAAAVQVQLTLSIPDEPGAPICAVVADLSEHQRLQESLRRVNRALRTISTCNQELVRATTETGLLESICQTIVSEGNYRMAWVGYAEHDELKSVRPAAYAGYEKGYLEKAHITWADTERGRGPTGVAIRTGRPTTCRNFLTDPNFAPWRAEAIRLGFASSAALPLRMNDIVFGALTIYAGEPGAFNDEEVELLMKLAVDLAYGITALRTKFERQQAEAALQKASAYNRSLIEASLDPLVTIGADGKITDVNAATESVTGRSRLQLIGTDFCDYFTEPEKARSAYQQVFRDGLLRDCPLDLRHSDGHVTAVLYNASVYRDERGDITGVFAAARDITDRKRAEAVVRAERQRFSDVLNRLPAYLILLTPDYHVPFANRYFRERFGDSCGRRCYEYLFNRTEPCENCETYTVLKTNAPHHWEWLGPDHRNYDIYDFPFADTDGSPLVMEVGLDITERKRAQAQIQQLNAELEQRVRDRTAELEAANKELESFAYSVSHDLRAPLRGIDGWSTALLEDYREKLDEQAREYLAQVCAEAQRMGQLIDDMLELSRVVRAELRQETVDLTAMTHAIVASLRKCEPGRQIEIIVAPGLAGTGDPQLIRQVLENLLGNAWKFTEKKDAARIEIGRITTPPSSGDTPPAAPPGIATTHDDVFFVRDNGAGFDMAHASKLFAPFQRLHRPSEFPGTGIGLATVQRILHRHGGKVWAEALPEQGATFYFTLPNKEPNHD